MQQFMRNHSNIFICIVKKSLPNFIEIKFLNIHVMNKHQTPHIPSLSEIIKVNTYTVWPKVSDTWTSHLYELVEHPIVKPWAPWVGPPFAAMIASTLLGWLWTVCRNLSKGVKWGWVQDSVQANHVFIDLALCKGLSLLPQSWKRPVGSQTFYTVYIISITEVKTQQQRLALFSMDVSHRRQVYSK